MILRPPLTMTPVLSLTLSFPRVCVYEYKKIEGTHACYKSRTRRRKKRKGLWLVEAQWPIRLVTESYFTGLTHVEPIFCFFLSFFPFRVFLILSAQRLFFSFFQRQYTKGGQYTHTHNRCECFYCHSRTKARTNSSASEARRYLHRMRTGTERESCSITLISFAPLKQSWVWESNSEQHSFCSITLGVNRPPYTHSPQVIIWWALSPRPILRDLSFFS